MKAALFDRLGAPLKIMDAEDPKPKTDYLLLKVCRCGIYGSDLHMTEDPVFGVEAGDILGHELSGEVIEVGSKAGAFKVGDQVTVAPNRGCGRCASCLKGEPAWCQDIELIGGGYAQYSAVAGRQCRKLPWGISAADGALAEPLSVALHGLMRAGMGQGERVLIVGTGAIGLAVAFWARRLGAGGVAVTDIHRHQEARAMELGAGAFVTADPDQASKSNWPSAARRISSLNASASRVSSIIASALSGPVARLSFWGFAPRATIWTASARFRRRSQSSCRCSSTCMNSQRP